MADATDLVNQALAEIGYSPLITDIYDGSRAAIVALQVYSQTRDDLLRARDWPFARRTKLLTLLKSALVPLADTWDEDQPVPPWRFEYIYPDDCLELRALRPDPVQFEGGDPLEPGYIPFGIASDFASVSATLPQKVILTDQEFALALYTTRLTNLDQWEPLATSALVDALAKKFIVSVGTPPQSVDLLKLKLGEAAQSTAEADARRG
jgi:hypothetical protein